MRSRKGTIKMMSSLVGNAAGHLALYPGSTFAIREVVLYEEQAGKLAEMRTWNEQEVKEFRTRSARHAGNLIRQRKYD